MSTGQTDALAAVLDGNGKHVWSAGFGDATSDVDVATAAAISSDKSIVLAGTFAGSISFGDKPLTSVGTSASFLTKLRTP